MSQPSMLGPGEIPKRTTATADTLAVTVLLAIIGTMMAFVWYYDQWLTDWDKLSQFIPWFGHIGDSLAAGDLPVWDPSSSAGHPFIGAPASGWLSIPIMLCFTLVDVITGYKLFVLFHMLLGGFGAYAFCRVIGMFPFPALVAGSAYALGPLLYSAIRWEAASGQVLMFIPVAMLAIECAIRARRLSSTLAWAALAGLIVCQMYVSSIPRLIYPAMLMAAWLAWRVLVDPLPQVGDRLTHLRKTVLIGIVLSVCFLGSVSAALLPQLEFNPQTNVAGSEYDVPGGNYTGGTLPYDYAIDMVFGDGETFPRTRFTGGAMIALAVLAVFGCRKKYGVPLFALATVAYIDFTTQGSIVRELLWYIPGVKDITGHRPMSANATTAFTMAILAGAGAQWLIEVDPRSERSLVRFGAVAAVAVGIVWLNVEGYFVGWWQVTAAAIAMATALLWIDFEDVGSFGTDWYRSATSWLAATQPLAARAILLGAVLLVPTIEDLGEAVATPGGPDIYNQSFMRIDAQRDAVNTIVRESDPDTAAGFLQDRLELGQPFRHASWTGADFEKQVFIVQTDPNTVGLVSNGRPMRLDLQGVYGYNPATVQTFVDYMEVVNGREQDYHFTEILGASVQGSPLLDMLNVRYVLMSRSLEPKPPIATEEGVAFVDDTTVVFENANAYNRAWIVHDVQPAMDGEELQLLNTGQADGHVTAFVDGDLPTVAPLAADAPADSVTVSRYEPETIELNASTSADGLMVLSEIYVKGWNAYVDGEQVDILRTNHTFRGVPLSAGQHEVVLKYEPKSLKIGLIGTGLSSVAMIGVWTWAGIDWGRRRRSSRTPAA